MRGWKAPVAALLLAVGIFLVAHGGGWSWLGGMLIGAFVALTYTEIERASRR